jgi:hypothetical protein
MSEERRRWQPSVLRGSLNKHSVRAVCLTQAQARCSSENDIVR